MALIHAQDPRRPIGGQTSGGRPDGTGYRTQIVQYPVMCGLDFIDYTPSYGRANRAPVTDQRREVTCPGCREAI